MVEGGSYGTVRGEARTAWQWGQGWSGTASGSYQRSDGATANSAFKGGKGFGTLNYDGSDFSFNLQAGATANDFGANTFYSAAYPNQWEATRRYLISARAESKGRVHLVPQVSWVRSLDHFQLIKGSTTGENFHRGDVFTAAINAWTQWALGRTAFGAEVRNENIYSTNLGDKLSVPEGHYTHAKARHTGNLWLRHAKRWRHFDAAASAGVSLTPYGTSALWSLSGGYTPAAGLHLGIGAFQSMRLPTFTDLYYTSPAQINNLDLTPERAVTYLFDAGYMKNSWRLSLQTYYRAGRDIIDWVWREDIGDKWHSEQTSRLDTYGIELSGGYTVADGFLRRVTLSYGYITTDRNSDIIAKGAMDYMRHKAALAVEVHFLRRMSLALTASVYDRNGSYTHYPVPGDPSLSEVRDYEPYFLLDGRLQWEKGICRLYVDATNITDSRYCDLGGIPLPGAWGTAGVALTIGR